MISLRNDVEKLTFFLYFYHAKRALVNVAKRRRITFSGTSIVWSITLKTLLELLATLFWSNKWRKSTSTLWSNRLRTEPSPSPTSTFRFRHFRRVRAFSIRWRFWRQLRRLSASRNGSTTSLNSLNSSGAFTEFSSPRTNPQDIKCHMSHMLNVS